MIASTRQLYFNCHAPILLSLKVLHCESRIGCPPVAALFFFRPLRDGFRSTPSLHAETNRLACHMA